MVYRYVCAGVVMAALLGFSALSSAAAQLLLDESFATTPVAQRGGEIITVAGGARGWRGPGGDAEASEGAYLSYDLRQLGLDGTSGTIEVTVLRDETEDPEVLLALVDADGGSVVLFLLSWEEGWLRVQGRDGALYWYSQVPRPGVSDWADTYYGVKLGKQVPRGETVHFAVTWGAGDENAIYLDGVRLPAQTPAGFSFGSRVAAAGSLAVGGEPIPGSSGGAWSTMHSLVTGVRLHNAALSASQLGSTLFLNSVAAEKSICGAGQELSVTLRGAMDKQGTFTLSGVAAGVSMTEVDDGVYVGSVTVPAGMNLASAALTGTLTDPATGQTVTLAGAPVTIDGTAPDAAPRILASAPWAGEIEVSWEPSPSADVAEYRVYRGEGADPVTTGALYETTRERTLTDTAVIPGIEYRYAVVPVDAAGNPGAPSDVASATAVPGDGPQVSGVTVEPFGRPARPGQVLTVSLTGQSGGTATVDLGTLATGLTLSEAGSTGVYTGSYTVPDTAVAETKSTHRLIAHLADPFGATTQAGPELVIVGQDALNDQTPPVIASASHDAFQVAGFSGALVAGDRVTVTLEGEPYGYASFAVPGVTEGVALAETPEGSGTYTGSYTVDWDDEGTAAALTATLADEGGNTTSTAVGQPLTFDTRVRLSVTARDTLLPADRESQTRLVVKAEDANGGKIAGHELSLMLSTTEEYTGVVGGGDVEGKRASKDDLDDLEVKWGGTTDFGGEVAATYTAGFAAKTALIVVKDLTTGDVGAGWLNTYVASTISITLTPVAGRAARGLADQATLTLTADPTWLTADGRSKSRLTATLKDFSGNPLAGKRISFALAGDNGRLKVLDNSTDSRGQAQAEYRAGTVIGTVMVTAASTDYAVTGSVQITLKSDAPAKIDLVADALTLPADGNSTATIAFRVTDIHDNPNDAVPVTLTLLDGSGDLSAAELLTDRNGQGTLTFTAGRSAGPAVIEARHTSRAPTADELRRIYGTVFVPRLLERQERERIKVAEWLAEPGDEVVKGQPLVELEMRGATWTLSAPAAGVFIREVKHRRDRVELADTLGYVEIDPEVWAEEYGR